MASESIDELILRINCTDGVLYCSRELLLKVSKTLQHLQDESPTLVNDVEVPFEKSIFQALIKFVDLNLSYMDSELSSEKLGQALDWLDTKKEIRISVKKRLLSLPTPKPVILDLEVLSEDVTNDFSQLFEFIARHGYMVLVEREDHDVDLSCRYTIYHDIEGVVKYCLDNYVDEYLFIPPEQRKDSLIMFFEDDGHYYYDGYGISDKDYEYLFEQMKANLEQQGRTLRLSEDDESRSSSPLSIKKIPQLPIPTFY